jgi:hypothetical protein
LLDRSGEVGYRDVDTLDALRAVGMAAGRKLSRRDDAKVVGAQAVTLDRVARQRDRAQSLAAARELQPVVGAACSARVVDVEADAPVRGDAGAEIGDTDLDVVDALEDRPTPPGSSRAARCRACASNRRASTA